MFQINYNFLYISGALIANISYYNMLKAVNCVNFYIEVFFQRILVIYDIRIHTMQMLQNRTMGTLIIIFKMASKMAPNNANDTVLKIMNFRMFYFLMTNYVHYIVVRSTQ